MLLQAEVEDRVKADQEAASGCARWCTWTTRHHRDIRKIGADWFRPKAMRNLKVRVDELAKRYVDRMAEIGPECDFVPEVAINLPLYVFLSLPACPRRISRGCSS